MRKKIGLAFFLFVFCGLVSFSQIEVNIDSLYNVFADSSKYDNILRIKLFGMNSEWENGYIVTLKRDTIVGQIKLHEDGIHASVKNGQAVKKYRADKYFAVRYGKRFFVSKKLDGYLVNAELLESGKINLYAYEQVYKGAILMGAGGQHRTSYYFENEKYIYGPFSSNWTDFRKSSAFESCIGDYKTLLNKYVNKEFKFSDLRIIIKIYNYWCNKNFR